MNLAHVHLILNHIAVVGVVIGLFLLALAILKRSTELKKVSLGVLVVMALMAIPTYMTGEPAEEIVEHLPGVSGAIIEQHEEAALIAVIAIGVLGAFALGGLLLFRRSHTIPNWFTVTALILALVASGLMGWTANLGGQIHHPEARPGFSPPPSMDQGSEAEEHENQ